MSRNELLDNVWDYKQIINSNTVDVHIQKIRKKLSYSLESKINTLMKSRSKALERTLSSFEEMLNQEKGTRRTLSHLGKSHNLLTSTGFKAKVMKGVDELEAEGWIRPEEKATVLEAYVKK